MPDAPKRILIVAHNHTVRETRGMLLRKAGYYSVSSVASDDEAMTILEIEGFDLVLIGRNVRASKRDLDERIRMRHPNLLILKIDDMYSPYPTRMTDAAPGQLLKALSEMLS
jgi:CheY-like chemotaxis protein